MELCIWSPYSFSLRNLLWFTMSPLKRIAFEKVVVAPSLGLLTAKPLNVQRTKYKFVMSFKSHPVCVSHPAFLQPPHQELTSTWSYILLGFCRLWENLPGTVASSAVVQCLVYMKIHHHFSVGLEIQGSKLPLSHDLTNPACLVLLEPL